MIETYLTRTCLNAGCMATGNCTPPATEFLVRWHLGHAAATNFGRPHIDIVTCTGHARLYDNQEPTFLVAKAADATFAGE